MVFFFLVPCKPRKPPPVSTPLFNSLCQIGNNYLLSNWLKRNTFFNLFVFCFLYSTGLIRR